MAGNRVYVSTFDNVTVAAIQDFFSLLASSTGKLELHWVYLSSNGTADAICRVRLRRLPATVTQGSGGSTPGMNPVDPLDAAAAATVHANDTSQAATTGSALTLMGFQWDVRAPFEYLPTPEDRPIARVSEALVLDAPAAPTSMSVSGIIKWREF